MKKFLCMACVLPMSIYAGGEFLPEETTLIDSQYDNVHDVQVEEVAPIEPKVLRIEKAPEAPKPQKVIKKAPVDDSVSDFYVGLAASYMNNDAEVINSITNRTTTMNNTHPYAVIAKAGYNIMDNLAIEGHVAKGFKTEKNIATVPVDSEFKNLWGVYLKPQVKLGDSINLHALAGYADTQQTMNTTAIDSNGFSFGAGVGYDLTKHFGLVFDAVRYANESASTIDSYSLGLDYRF